MTEEFEDLTYWSGWAASGESSLEARVAVLYYLGTTESSISKACSITRSEVGYILERLRERSRLGPLEEGDIVEFDNHAGETVKGVVEEMVSHEETKAWKHSGKEHDFYRVRTLNGTALFMRSALRDVDEIRA